MAKYSHEEWKRLYRWAKDRADSIYSYRRDRVEAILKTVGMIYCGCSIHNCANSQIGVGWGAGPGGRERIKACKRIRYIESDNRPDSLISAWDRRVR